jgi:hypothetical protein
MKAPFRHSVAKGANPQNAYHIRNCMAKGANRSLHILLILAKGANRSLHILLILAKGVKFQNAYILC